MIAYTIIIALALITRFVELGTRVMSHDESLHTYYSWRLFEFGEFNHTPLMHGPLLFHMTALSYFLFGDSDFTARIYPALLGVLIVVSAYHLIPIPAGILGWLVRGGMFLLLPAWLVIVNFLDSSEVQLVISLPRSLLRKFQLVLMR